jgi:hypothetical protein
MNRIFFLLLAALICSIQPALAAFPAHKEQQAPPPQRHFQRYHRTLNTLPFRELKGPRLRRRHLNPDDRYNITTEGIFSFMCGIMMLVSFTALALTSFSFFIVPAFVFAVLATVFGSIGIGRRKRAYAMIGMALGILGMVAGFVVLAAVL